jgi:hypothetical protein
MLSAVTVSIGWQRAGVRRWNMRNWRWLFGNKLPISLARVAEGGRAAVVCQDTSELVMAAEPGRSRSGFAS